MMRTQPSLVTPEWLESRLGDGGVRVFEVDAEWSDAYAAGHLPNAVGGEWKQVCWDAKTREFPDAGALSSAAPDNPVYLTRVGRQTPQRKITATST
jgi:3-mercaptopyruvate sulfurtransferase SseA